MTTSRRKFIQRSAALTALSSLGLSESMAHHSSLAKDINITLCLAYFYGLQERKIELSKQMGVTGAVSPSSPWMLVMRDAKPWEYEVLKVVKEA